MNTHLDIDKLVQQTHRYEFSDGLRDFQLGLMMTASGIMTWIVFDKADVWMPLMAELATRFGAPARYLILILVMVPSLLALTALLLMRYVRRRWLWRNSGYVSSRQIVVPFPVSVISVFVLLVPLVLGWLAQMVQLVPDSFTLRLMLVASGWSFGYTLVEMGRRLDLRRYVQIGLWASLITAVLLVLPITLGLTALLWGIVWGAMLTLSGIGPLSAAIHNVNTVQHE